MSEPATNPRRRIPLFWLVGTAVAALGVVGHRLGGLWLPPASLARAGAQLAGMTAAFGGLLILIFGMNRQRRG